MLTRELIDQEWIQKIQSADRQAYFGSFSFGYQKGLYNLLQWSNGRVKSNQEMTRREGDQDWINEIQRQLLRSDLGDKAEGFRFILNAFLEWGRKRAATGQAESPQEHIIYHPCSLCDANEAAV